MWCFAVNDAFVMGAWATTRRRAARSASWPTAARTTRRSSAWSSTLAARGLGLRCNRFSMLVEDGVVKTLNVEGPGKFEVSDGATMVKQA